LNKNGIAFFRHVPSQQKKAQCGKGEKRKKQKKRYRTAPENVKLLVQGLSTFLIS
jgi:hypothetical protein